MLTIALTGGIASGKSVVARRFSDKGAYIVDADQISREVVAPGEPALEEILARWGSHLLNSDGGLDRKELGSIVFNDAAELAALGDITHPRIAERTNTLIESRLAENPATIVVHDVPLLYGNGREFERMTTISIAVPEETRIHRMVTYRGMSRAEAEARIAAQPSDADRASISDVVISNNAALAALEDSIDWLWTNWILPYNQNLVAGNLLDHPRPHAPGELDFRIDSVLARKRLTAHGIDAADPDNPGTFTATSEPSATQLSALGWLRTNGIAVPADPRLPWTLAWES